MGTRDICFDSAAYKRALADLKRTGFKVKDEKVPIEGQFKCTKDNYLLEPEITPPDKVDNKKFAYDIDAQGNAYRYLEGLTDGIRAVLQRGNFSEFKSKELNQAVSDGLRKLYGCELNGDMACVFDTIGQLQDSALKFGTINKKNHKRLRTERRSWALELGSMLMVKSSRVINLASEEKYAWTKNEVLKMASIYKKGELSIPTDFPKDDDDDNVAKTYLVGAFKVFSDIANEYPGYWTIFENGKEIGCSYSESKFGNGITIDCPDLEYSRTIDFKTQEILHNRIFFGEETAKKKIEWLKKKGYNDDSIASYMFNDLAMSGNVKEETTFAFFDALCDVYLYPLEKPKEGFNVKVIFAIHRFISTLTNEQDVDKLLKLFQKDIIAVQNKDWLFYAISVSGKLIDFSKFSKINENNLKLHAILTSAWLNIIFNEGTADDGKK